jgi:hypothetical protein
MKTAAVSILLGLIWMVLLPASGNDLTGHTGGRTEKGKANPIDLNFPDSGFSGSSLLGPVSDVADPDIDSLFLAANNLYEKGDYEPALEAYHAIILNGFESADLYYNMGNAAYRSNSIGHAILYYEKAIKLDPSHEDAIHNLDYVSRYRQDTFEGVPELFFRSWIKGFIQMMPEKTWSILSLILFMVILAGLVVYLFSRHMAVKKFGFITGIVAVVLFVIALSSSISRYRKMIHPDSGIVLVPSVVVRSSPSESGTELFVLHEGTKIKVSEKVDGWQNIKVKDGREGWIMTSDFATI